MGSPSGLLPAIGCRWHSLDEIGQARDDPVRRFRSAETVASFLPPSAKADAGRQQRLNFFPPAARAGIVPPGAFAGNANCRVNV